MNDGSAFDIFPYVWLGLVAVFGGTQLIWGFYEYRHGEARWAWLGLRWVREEEPFYYWLAIGGHFLGFVVACCMFWLGLDMLDW